MKTRKSHGLKPTSQSFKNERMILAQISFKQAVVGALIGFLSAVLVAVIANVDKIKGNQDTAREEVGYLESRSHVVDSAFQDAQGRIQSALDLARKERKIQLVKELKTAGDVVQRGHARFRELSASLIQATATGQRLQASKLRTDANELTFNVNKELFRGVIIYGYHSHTGSNAPLFLPIPPIGRGVSIPLVETCQVLSTDKSLIDDFAGISAVQAAER